MGDYLLLAQQVAAVQDATGTDYQFDAQIRELGWERDAARRELAELRAVLRDLEWSGEDDAEFGGTVQCCPLCEARPALEGTALVGHTADCRLGALLAPPAERGGEGAR